MFTRVTQYKRHFAVTVSASFLHSTFLMQLKFYSVIPPQNDGRQGDIPDFRGNSQSASANQVRALHGGSML